MSKQSPLIIVEGKTDEFFFKSYLNFLKIDTGKYQLKEICGKDNLKNNTELFKKNITNRKVILILDWDREDCPINQLCKKYKKEKTITDFFLIKKDLEDLLIPLAKKQEYIECFEDYQKCIKARGSKATPLKDKSKIYAYLQAEDAPKKRKEVDFSEYFDFKDKKLNELKKFLFSHLNN